MVSGRYCGPLTPLLALYSGRLAVYITDASSCRRALYILKHRGSRAWPIRLNHVCCACACGSTASDRPGGDASYHHHGPCSHRPSRHRRIQPDNDVRDDVSPALDRVGLTPPLLAIKLSSSYYYAYSALPYQVNPYPIGRGPQSGCG